MIISPKAIFLFSFLAMTYLRKAVGKLYTNYKIILFSVEIILKKFL